MQTGVLLALVACCLPVPLDAMTIAAGGTPRVAIVVPADAPNPVRFAAEELKRFLERITRAEFAIVNVVPRDTPAIVLGEDLAKQAGISIDGLTRDGYVLKTVAQCFYVVERIPQAGDSACAYT